MLQYYLSCSSKVPGINRVKRNDYQAKHLVWKEPRGTPVPELEHYLLTLAERRDVAVRASPATYVSASAAPILIVHGDEDEVVDLYQSTSFHALLVAAGADSTLRIVKGGGHGRGSEFSDRSLLAVVGEFFDRTLAPRRSVVNSSRLGYP